MHVYIRSEPKLFTVGFYDPQGQWHPNSDYDDPDKAARQVAYLNGYNPELIQKLEQRVRQLESAVYHLENAVENLNSAVEGIHFR